MYPATPDPESVDAFQETSTSPQSIAVAVMPVGTLGAVVSAPRVVVLVDDVLVLVVAALVVVVVDVVVTVVVVVVEQAVVDLETAPLSADTLPALSTAETVYEYDVEPRRVVSDVDVDGART